MFDSSADKNERDRILIVYGFPLVLLSTLSVVIVAIGAVLTVWRTDAAQTALAVDVGIYLSLGAAFTALSYLFFTACTFILAKSGGADD